MAYERSDKIIGIFMGRRRSTHGQTCMAYVMAYQPERAASVAREANNAKAVPQMASEG